MDKSSEGDFIQVDFCSDKCHEYFMGRKSTKQRNSTSAFHCNRNRDNNDSLLLAPPPDPPKNLILKRKSAERTDSLSVPLNISPVNELTIVPPDPVMPRYIITLNFLIYFLNFSLTNDRLSHSGSYLKRSPSDSKLSYSSQTRGAIRSDRDTQRFTSRSGSRYLSQNRRKDPLINEHRHLETSSRHIGFVNFKFLN